MRFWGFGIGRSMERERYVGDLVFGGEKDLKKESSSLFVIFMNR